MKKPLTVLMMLLAGCGGGAIGKEPEMTSIGRAADDA